MPRSPANTPANPPARSPGRPRGFDRDAALRKAMEVFWAHGYDGAKLEALLKVMGGITAPSLYAAFGSKEGLFREAVDLYTATVGAPVAAALDAGATARSSIEGVLRESIKLICSPTSHRGCLVTLGTVNCSHPSQKLRDHLRSYRTGFARRIVEKLKADVTRGTLPASADVEAITEFYLTVIDGLVLHAREGAPRKTLEATARTAMRAWDSVVAG